MSALVADLMDVRDKARRLVDDLPYFSQHCLKIRPKSGGLAPLVLNRVQLDRLDDAFGSFRLTVMPDVARISIPFCASPEKQASR